MDFAKGRVFQTSQRLLEEVTGQRPEVSYAAQLYPAAALPDTGNDYGFGREFRSDVPVGLDHHLYTRAPIPREQADYRFMLAGNLALFLAHTGEHEQAELTLRTVSDVTAFSADPEPYFWERPTYEQLESTLTILRKSPSQSTPWLGLESPRCIGCGLYATLDVTAARRNAAHERHDDRTDAEQGAVLYRFRAAMFDRAITVPLQMLESLDLVKSHLR